MTVDRDLKLFYEYAKRKTLATTRALGPTLGIVRTTAKASFFDSARVLQNAGAGVARFDHDPVTGESLGLLVEEARTNLALQSEDLSIIWTNVRSTDSQAVAGQTAPDGASTVNSLNEDGTSANDHYIEQIFVASDDVIYTFSDYLKAANRNWVNVRLFRQDAGARHAYFDLNAGTIGTVQASTTATMKDVVNDWFRCSVSADIGPTGPTERIRIIIAEADNDTIFDGLSQESILSWGKQLEVGSFPTSYIPTVAASVMRNADGVSTTDLSWLGSSQTFYTHLKTGNIDNDTTVWSLHDGTVNERIAVEITSGVMHFIGIDGGVTQWDISTAVAADTEYRIAVTWTANDIAFYLNGTQVGVDSDATLPTLTTLNISSDHADAEHLNSTRFEDRSYNVRKANQFLEDLSNGLINESIDQISQGFFSIANCVKDPGFVAEMRAEAENADVWATWVGGVNLPSDPVPKGSANLDLNIALIQNEAEGSAVWARWAPGVQRENTGGLQLDMVAAINAGFVVSA